jgi:hypothetical protein
MASSVLVVVGFLMLFVGSIVETGLYFSGASLLARSAWQRYREDVLIPLDSQVLALLPDTHSTGSRRRVSQCGG